MNTGTSQPEEQVTTIENLIKTLESHPKNGTVYYLVLKYRDKLGNVNKIELK